jgi:hypothetical protein
MSRQLVAKEILIVGDSNIQRNLLSAGRLYSDLSENGLARNLVELAEAIKLIHHDKYKLIIFAMMTNIIVDAGNTATSTCLDARLAAIKPYLEALIKDISIRKQI